MPDNIDRIFLKFISAPPDFSNSEVSLHLSQAGRDRRSVSSNNTATPSPRKQSIEDLASSVENLKEKLMRLPFAVAANNHELAKEGEENIPSKPPPPPFPKGSLSRSRYDI